MYNVYGAMFSTSTRHFGSSSLLDYLTGECDTVREYKGWQGRATNPDSVLNPCWTTQMAVTSNDDI